MTYAEFKANYPAGSSVASPEGTYMGQCVSYVRQYMALVDGVKTGPLGDAVDFASNKTFLTYYEKVANPQAGDIIVWGDDAGSWTGVYGHIGIYDGSGYMMNQNYGGSLKVSRNLVFSPGFIGYYRINRKGEEVRVENNAAWRTRMAQVLTEITGEPLSDDEFKAWVGSEPFAIVEALIDDKKRSAKNDTTSDADSRIKAFKDALGKL